LACGKSFVGHSLADLGCYLIEADKLGHQVMMPDGEAYDAIVREFGPAVLDAEGRISRRKLSGLVWGNPERLEKLNSLVHPPVREREESRMAEIAQADPAAIVVVEAATLVETGRYKDFDRLIVAACSAGQQMERALERGSYNKEEILARMSRQLPLEQKLSVADYVIDTSGEKEATLEQVRRVYSSLRSLTA
jgi:dephospho-CoA kinase